jgi:cysteine desulfurase
MNTRVYLDFNATCPLLPQAWEAMKLVYTQPCNASSIHSYGRVARKMLDEARARIAHLLGAEGALVVFASSGTEANNLALHGMIKQVDNLAVSAVEHISVLKPAEILAGTIIPVDENGIVQLNVLEKILKNLKGKTLVSIQLANNETGVIQPVKEISELVYRYSGFFHCDASQAVGKIPVDFTQLNVDMLTISGHKFGAPVGAAALVVKKGLHLAAHILGGGQEQGYRAGTENVAAIVGMAAALETASRAMPDSTLRDKLEAEIIDFAPEALIFGKNSPRLPNTSCIGLRGMSSETQLINFDLGGVAVSSGSACSSGKVAASHVLAAMQAEKEVASGAIRISSGRTTTEADIQQCVEIWKKNYSKTLQTKAA